MDWIASHGRSGLLDTTPEGMQANSDVAIMSILGYNPVNYYTGRGPLEAAGMGVKLNDGDMAFRCNLITEEDGKIKDYSGGHISTEEAEDLMWEITEEYSDLGDFFVGVDYRHLFVLRDPKEEAKELESTPPHTVIGGGFEEYLLKPSDLDLARSLNDMMRGSRELLTEHPINKERKRDGKDPANAIWLWGQGIKPNLESIEGRYGFDGAVISAVTLVKGLGSLAGMEIIEVPGATGYYDTSYENKAEYALEALENHDLVLIHVEAPDEAGHAGDVDRKIQAIEDLDSRLIGKLLDGMENDFTISVMPDHPTPIDVMDHVAEPVPFSVYSSVDDGDGISSYDEFSVEDGSLGVIEGHEFMEFLSSL
jgi:2,3-bisphosphoglycerate-independent phosphoglycerate mutase